MEIRVHRTVKLPTQEDLANEIISLLRDDYELTYVDYRDELNRDQIDAMVSGDTDKLWESIEEWESDSRWESCQVVIEELAPQAIKNMHERDTQGLDLDVFQALWDDGFEYGDDWNEVRYAIEERDKSDIFGQLARNTGKVALRVMTHRDEDNAYSYEKIDPTAFLTDLGFEATDENVKVAQGIINEAGAEFGYKMVCYVFDADLSELWKMPYDTEYVDIVNPGVWLGNYGSGDGWADQLIGTVRVKRADIKTDKGNFGYGWTEVTSEKYTHFDAEIKVVAATTAD